MIKIRSSPCVYALCIVTDCHDLVVGGDLGCLMNIQGKLSRQKDEGQASNLKVRHVAEVLAGMTDGPAIGEPE